MFEIRKTDVDQGKTSTVKLKIFIFGAHLRTPDLDRELFRVIVILLTMAEIAATAPLLIESG